MNTYRQMKDWLPFALFQKSKDEVIAFLDQHRESIKYCDAKAVCFDLEWPRLEKTAIREMAINGIN